MTDFVIDANILMSILISGKASYKPLLTYYNFILPNFVLIEIDKYQPLYEGLKKQGFRKVLLFEDFLKTL